jgi:hypothetical protein
MDFITEPYMPGLPFVATPATTDAADETDTTGFVEALRTVREQELRRRRVTTPPGLALHISPLEPVRLVAREDVNGFAQQPGAGTVAPSSLPAAPNLATNLTLPIPPRPSVDCPDL